MRRIYAALGESAIPLRRELSAFNAERDAARAASCC
jgi:hypothetical protein